MVMIPPVLAGGTGTAAAGSVGAAGSATGTSTFPGAESHGGWVADDIFYVPGGGHSGSQGGFDYQGKPYDPILNEPMNVSAETHGDYWEDDMDYSETVSYEGIDTRTGAQTKTDEKTCENCPPRELITQWRETDLAFIQRILSEVGIYWRTEMDDERGLDVYMRAT
ncbi:contractile injection system protein, VgrG/Pvc8 family [Klebsiella pneumoniae]|nr:contractile injection system protein, VgrG/Pvc8 family [Klebsiella pneumoniae]